MSTYLPYKRLLLLAVMSFALLAGCGISQEHFDAMVKSRDSLNVLYKQVVSKNDDLLQRVRSKETSIEALKIDIEKLTKEKNECEQKYALLSANSNEDNANLTAQLEDIRKDLLIREKKVIALQKRLKERDSAMNTLRQKIQNALVGFQNNGLEVQVKDGKVYVSMSNKLLFKSGSTDIDKKGREALSFLANVLNTQDDIVITIEGHTDNAQVRGSSRFSDNWDLSVLRSTEVSRYLVNNGSVDPKRIIASGRSEYFPVMPGETPEARASNRRTEIIITPRLDYIMDAIK